MIVSHIASYLRHKIFQKEHWAIQPSVFPKVNVDYFAKHYKLYILKQSPPPPLKKKKKERKKYKRKKTNKIIKKHTKIQTTTTTNQKQK